MPAPTFSSSTPADGATNVYLNQKLVVTFSTDLDATSVSGATVILRSVALDTVVDATLSVSGAVITIVPYTLLIANSVYRLTLVGNDLSLSTGAIESAPLISNLEIEVSLPKNGDQELAEIKKGFVGFVKVGRANPEPSKDSYAPMSGVFPDPIIYQKSKNIPFGTTQPLWVSVKIPKDATPGNYLGEVNITGEIKGQKFVKKKGN